jgi:hypothetical protein
LPRISFAKTSVRRNCPVGKYNFDVVRTIFIAILLQTAAAYGESAVLECISSTYVDSKPDGTTFYQFRMTTTFDWKLTKASLFLHATGDQPKSVEVGLATGKWNEFDAAVVPVAGKMRKYEVTAIKDGWIRIELDPAQARQIKHGVAVRVTGAGRTKPFHLRETMQHSPYLLLEGTI